MNWVMQSERQGPPSRRFAFDTKYDFSYRPATYWPETPNEETLVSKIKGTQRRDIARRALEGEELPRLGDDELYREAMELVLKEKLDDDERKRWGGVHPAMMGGEFLPDPEEGEVEIARIELASVTADVIQVLAKRTENGEEAQSRIRYRVVDEYEAEGSRLLCSPEITDEPLTFGEIIELIDSTRQEGWGEISADVAFTESFRDLNRPSASTSEDLEELANFVSVSSAVYPQLSSYYDDRALAWLETVLAEEREQTSEGKGRR